MKMRTLCAAALVAVTLVSCSKDPVNVPGSGSAGKYDNAYMAISVKMPQALTKADSGPTEEIGTAEESGVSSVYVIGFDGGDNIVGIYNVSSNVNINDPQKNTAFSVSEELRRVFVVINPSTDVLEQINGATTYAAMNKALATDVAELTQDGKFLMTSAGAGIQSLEDIQVQEGIQAQDSGLVAVTPCLPKSDSQEDINQAITDAQTNPAKVAVDRAVSKVTLKNTFTDPEGRISIEGWTLNTTNKSYFLYGKLVAYGLKNKSKGIYRQDPNFTKLTLSADGSGDAADAFNWLKNADYNSIVWNGLNKSVYCLENTMDADAQDYNNTTKIVVKAHYTPEGVTPGESWFMYNGEIKTLAELKAIYNAASQDIQDKFDDFLNQLGLTNKKWTGTGLTIADLDAVENGGYLAATVPGGSLIQYFQKSVCYYDITIKHDNRMGENLLGRWGVVRNNSYTLDITNISKPGFPYIPDPTDPTITDPENPDPENPDPDDDRTAYIAVSISVNPWTGWTQEVQL